MASIPLSVDISRRTRLRLTVTEDGEHRSLIAIAELPEEKAIGYFLEPDNCRYMIVHEAVPVPFALAYIVDRNGRLMDDCLLEQAEDESLMVEEFLRLRKLRKGQYFLVRAIQRREVRTILSVTPLEKKRTFESVTV